VLLSCRSSTPLGERPSGQAIEIAISDQIYITSKETLRLAAENDLVVR
jgi:hypothetical protein